MELTVIWETRKQVSKTQWPKHNKPKYKQADVQNDQFQ